MFPEMLVVNMCNIDKRFWLNGPAQKGPGANTSTGSRPGAFSARGLFLRGQSLMNRNCLLLRKIASCVDKKSTTSFVYELTGFIEDFT